MMIRWHFSIAINAKGSRAAAASVVAQHPLPKFFAGNAGLQALLLLPVRLEMKFRITHKKWLCVLFREALSCQLVIAGGARHFSPTFSPTWKVTFSPPQNGKRSSSQKIFGLRNCAMYCANFAVAVRGRAHNEFLCWMMARAPILNEKWRQLWTHRVF